MRVRDVSAMLAVLALAAGCDSAPAPTGPNPAPSFGNTAASVPSANVVSGVGYFDATVPGIGLVLFEYRVEQRGTANATGGFYQRFFLDGYKVEFEGKATCLAVDRDNHRAWVGGVITKNRSTHPSYQDTSLMAVGKDIWFRTVDYGNGTPPDRSTVFGFKGGAGIITSAEYCQARLWSAGDARTWPVLSDIQIRFAP